MLTKSELAGHEILEAGPVALRRDLYRFVQYIEGKELFRTVRGNSIPKTDARKLAKLLSWSGEAEAVEEDGCGYWSDFVADLARRMGIIKFDIEGIYRGYTSTEPSFPDNRITLVDKEWQKYLKSSALEKETLILESLLKSKSNEFFVSPTLVDSKGFDTFGSATGPAGKMDLPAIRRGLIKFLAGLNVHEWHNFHGVVELLRERAPHLILDPAHRGPDEASSKKLRQWEYGPERGRGKRPETVPEDIYRNFREYGAKDEWMTRKARRIHSGMSDSFHRVEGRFLEFFLCETFYLSGFAALAFRAAKDPHGQDVTPAFERLRAFRLTSRFIQIVKRDPEFNRVKTTVLPNFEVIVEAASYPESTLEKLALYASPVATATIHGDGPVHRLLLDRARVVATSARDAKAATAVAVLEELTAGAPGSGALPPNVAHELAGWTRKGEQVVLYENFGLLEFIGPPAASHADIARARNEIEGQYRSHVVDDSPEGFLLVKDCARVTLGLEEQLKVPISVQHSRTGAPGKGQARLGQARPGFAKVSAGFLKTVHESIVKECSSAVGQSPLPGAPVLAASRPPRKVSLAREDLVGYRVSDAEALDELERAIKGKARTCIRAADDLLIISADAIPNLRKEIKRLSSGHFSFSEEHACLSDGSLPARAPSRANVTFRITRDEERNSD